MGLFLSFSIMVPFKNVYYCYVFLDLFKGRRYISFELEPQLGTSCTLQHVRWAYLLVHGYGQSEGPGAPALELELPSHVWFLWPLFLARPTPEAPDAALLRHNKAPTSVWFREGRYRWRQVEQVYEVVVPRAPLLSQSFGASIFAGRRAAVSVPGRRPRL